jgi:hypothetical protein
VRAAAATPATTAARAACSGDGLSPETRFANAPLRTPDISAQLRLAALRLVDELDDERLDELPLLVPARLRVPPLLVPPADREALGFDAAAVRLRPDEAELRFDELDPPRLEEPDPPPLDEPDPPRREELDPPRLDELAPRREELDPPRFEELDPPPLDEPEPPRLDASAWRLKRCVRDCWLSWSSSSSSSFSPANSESHMSSISE